MFAVYSLLYSLGLCLLAPRALWHRLTGGRYGIALPERLGQVPDRLLECRGGIWIHAVSVGEVQAARGLIPHLRERLPGVRIVLSTTTPTGQAVAAHAGADDVFYAPLDTGRAVGAYLDALQPRALLLVETEIWPNLLRHARRRGVWTALVNARLSASACARYRVLVRLWPQLLGHLDLVCARTEREGARFLTLGVAEDRVLTTGNLKADAAALIPPEHIGGALRRQLGQAASEHLLVAGCTMADEETKVLRAYRRIRDQFPEARLLLAPRHPERFDEVATLIRDAGYRCFRRSSPTPMPPADVDVVLLDTIGELPAAYGLGSIAFVGGSLVPTGGHNLLEPAVLGRPVLFGPSTFNFEELAARLLANGAAHRVADAEQLAEHVLALLRDPQARADMGDSARRVALADSDTGPRTAERIVTALVGAAG